MVKFAGAKAALFSGVALAVLTTPDLATAATANNISNIQASQITGGCRISWSADVTGQLGDALGPTQDAYRAEVTDQAGSIVPGSVPVTGVQSVGVTSTVQMSVDVGIPLGNERYPKFVAVSDVFGPSSGILAQAPIPDNILEAAGGFCLNVRENNEPDVDAGPDANANSLGEAVLAGTASDLEMDPLTFQWNQVSGPATAIISNANTLTPSIAAPKTSAPSTYVFELAANDGLDTSTDTVSVFVPANVAPIADAGVGQTASANSTFSLDASASSDPDGDPLSFQWTQTSGPAVTITNANSAAASFTTGAAPPTDQNLVFTLSVDDGVSTAQDTVTFFFPANQPPTVNAGPDQTAPGGSTVTLAGSASDPENDAITLQWTQTGGQSVTLSDPTAAAPTFTAPTRGPNAQTLTFQLVATDSNNNASNPDTVQINIPANQAPTAQVRAPSTGTGGTTVTLSGTLSSDPDGDPLIYQWSQISGPSAAIQTPGDAVTDIVLPAATNSVQLVEFQLLVADPFDAIATQAVSISIAANNAPVAEAGPDGSIVGDAPITLDGSGSSDSDNDAITFSWTQVAGPAVTLTGANTANPTFTAPPKSNIARALVFELVVNDGLASSAPDTVTLTIAANAPPVPDAGVDQNVQGGSVVTLDASASSDPDGDSLAYSWTQVSGPAVTLSDTSNVQPTFTAPQSTGSAQTLVFQLTVDDGFIDPIIGPPGDRVVITIAANRPPVADAGVDQGPIDSGTTVTLDGSGSSDPDGDALTYTWTQVSGTAVTLSDASAASPNFTAPVVAGNEDLVFELVVSDGQTSSVADRVTVGIRAVGSVTIVQRVIGSDTTVAFTSDIAALNGNVTTSGGAGQIAATGIAVGTYSLTAADLSGQGYALTDITCNDGDSTANLASRSVAVALSPSEDLVCTFTLANTREAASLAINQFLTGRNALILSHQPDLQRRLDRLSGAAPKNGSVTAHNLPVPGGSALPLSLSLGDGRAQASTSLSAVAAAVGDRKRGTGLFDMWAELYYSRARIGGQEGNFRMAYIGADYRIDDAVLLGALVAFDDFSDRGALEAGEAEGNGWMAGPYITAKLDEDFYAEARAAWGSSDNRVSPLGTFEDSFDTSRSFYSGSLIGQFDLGDKTTFRPEVTLRYISEKQKAYVDSLNITIPSQTVDQGDISFRPRLSHLVEMESGWSMRPYGEVEGIITFGDTSGEVFASLANAGQVLDLGSLRARVEGGVDFMSDTGIRATVAAFHDGIGSDNFRSSGVHVGLSFGF